MADKLSAAEPVLPRGALKPATDAIMELHHLDRGWAGKLASAALAAALPVIERAVLKRAAQRMLLLQALARGWLCPACHGKPAVTPTPRNGEKLYRCGCGHTWERKGPRSVDYGMDPDYLVRKLARGEPLPELPPKVTHG